MTEPCTRTRYRQVKREFPQLLEIFTLTAAKPLGGWFWNRARQWQLHPPKASAPPGGGALEEGNFPISQVWEWSPREGHGLSTWGVEGAGARSTDTVL